MMLVLLFAGCGGSAVDPDRTETVPVTGTVTHNGEPVEGASVTFMAQSADGRGASGTTDASGEFTLTTFEPGDGAIPGSYRVKIAKTVVEGGPSEEEYQAAAARGMTLPQPEAKEMLPVKYKDVNTSQLTAEVKEDDDKEFDFALTG